MTDPSRADELEALERQGWEALSSDDGAAFYQELMADEGLMVFPGMVLDRRAALDAIAAADPWSWFELDDIRVTEPAPDIGIVTYQATARRGDGEPYRALMTTVYVRRDRAWRLVIHQQTPSGGA